MSNVKLPEPNNEIYNAIRNSKLVIFLGAGVSNLLGLPRWNDLAKTLLDDAVNEDILTLIEKTLILSEINSDSKKIISIVFEKYKLNGKEDTFYQHLSKHLTLDNTKTIESPIIDLVKDIPALYLTTNADNTLDDCFDKDTIYYDNNYSDWRRTNPALIQIHGKVTLPSSLVFTSKQYIDRYTNEDFINYLESVFCTGQTVLFIGYSLNEFELLERISRNLSKDQNSNIFALQPYFSFQSALESNFDLYFKSLNITQIPYNIDIHGFSTLNLILSDWILKFKERSLFLVEEERAIELINEKPDKHIIGQIKNLFKNNDNLISYAIYHLYNSKHSIKWIEVFSTLYFTDIKYGFSKENNVNNPTWAYINVASDLYEKTKSNSILKILTKKTLALFRNNDFKKILNNTKVLINLSNYIFDIEELYKNKDIISGYKSIIETSHDLFGIFFYRIFKNNSSIIKEHTLTEIEFHSLEFLLKNYNETKFEEYIARISKYLFSKEIDVYAIKIIELTYESLIKVEQDNPFIFHSLGSLISIDLNKHIKDENFSDEHMLIFILLFSYSSLNNEQQEIFLTKCLETQTSIFNKISLYIINKSFTKNYYYLLSKPFCEYYNVEFYSDYYKCIKNNINYIPNELIKHIKDSFSIDSYNDLEIKEQHMIYELSKLLTSYNLNSKVTTKTLYKEEFDYFKKPENISQLVQFNSYSSEDIIPTLNLTLKDASNLNEVSFRLSKMIYQYPFDANDYSYRFGAYISERIVNFDITIDDFIGFNSVYKHSLLLAILSKISEFNINLIVKILNIYIDELIVKGDYKIISSLLQEIIHIKYKPLLSNIDFVEEIEKLTNVTYQFYLNEYINDQDGLYFVINTLWIFNCFRILMAYNEEKVQFVQTLLSNGINQNIKNSELISFVFSKIYQFYNLDKSWIIEILDNLDKSNAKWKQESFALILKHKIEKNIFELILNYDLFSEYIYSEVKDNSFDEYIRKNVINGIIHYYFVSELFHTKSSNPIFNDKNGYNIIYVFETLRDALDIAEYTKQMINNFLIDYVDYILNHVDFTHSINNFFDDFIEIILKLNIKSEIIILLFQQICNKYSNQLSNQYYEYLTLILDEYTHIVYNSLLANSINIPSYYIDIDMVKEIIILLSKHKQYNIHNLINQYHKMGFDMVGMNKDLS